MKLKDVQGIAYKRNGEPCVMWPAVIPILDEEGIPTEEITTNLDDLIAALPEGTEYTLVTEATQAAWWAKHTSRQDIANAIRAELNEVDVLSIRPTRAISSGRGTQHDHDKIQQLEERATKLRKQLAEVEHE